MTYARHHIINLTELKTQSTCKRIIYHIPPLEMHKFLSLCKSCKISLLHISF